MFARFSHTRLLRYSGLFTWAVVGVPLVYSWLQPLFSPAAEDLALRPMPWEGWAAYAAFGASYAWLTRGLGVRQRTWGDFVLLLILTLSAIGVSYYNASGLGSVLLMVAACVLPWLLPLWLGVAWLVVSQLAIVPVFVRFLDFSLVEALLQSLLYAGYSGFVFVTSLVARQQAQAREEQRRLNAELRATRVLLAESARINERTRISRELHDLRGHHLTALSRASARNLWITARRVDGHIGIEARDDGAGADAIIPGNGLRGMRERLSQHGGALQVDSTPGTGFRLRLSLPTLGVGPAACINECPEGATP